MKKHIIIITIACAAVMISRCKKETCDAGTGGDITFQIYPEHHGDAIRGAAFYVEFNTQSAPGSLSDFDLTVQADSGSAFVTVKSMKCGDYFIYSVGTDVDSLTSETVKGGIPYSVPNAAGSTVKIIIPVTE